MLWRDLPRFKAFPGLLNGHVQTITAHLLPVDRIERPFERWIVRLPDGDELWCRFYAGDDRHLDIFFHGLGGCADSKYIQVGGAAALALGHSVLLVNHRGAGEGLAHASGLYHSGRFEDAAAVIRFARERKPQAMITTIGFSLSANLLLNLVSRGSASDWPDRAIVVNPPIDVFETARLLSSPACLVYDQKFVRDLRQMLVNKVRVGRLDRVPEFPRFCRIVDFDEIYTAKAAGFKNRDELYQYCCSYPFADRIRVPTLILTAEDDPFIPADSFRQAKYSSSVQLQIEPRGGHVGYLSGGRGASGRRWLGEFLTAALSETKARL